MRSLEEQPLPLPVWPNRVKLLVQQGAQWRKPPIVHPFFHLPSLTTQLRFQEESQSRVRR